MCIYTDDEENEISVVSFNWAKDADVHRKYLVICFCFCLTVR